MTSRLLELATRKYVNLVECYSQSRNIQYNFPYCQLMKLSPERLEAEEKKCPEEDHKTCLPHLCVKAHLKLISEVKGEIGLQTYFADEKLATFTTAEPRPNFLNPYREALVFLGYSEEYAKEFYTLKPPTDYCVLKDFSMNCAIQNLGGNKLRLIWSVTDNALSLEEIRALAAKHNDVIEKEKLRNIVYNILD